MPVTVKCHSGKCEKTFLKLNPGDINSYDCEECVVSSKETKIEGAPVESEKKESSAERKARLKAEKARLKLEAEAVKEEKSESL